MIPSLRQFKSALFVITIAALFAIAPGCKKADPPPPVAAIQLGPESYAVAAMGEIESGPTISGMLVPRDQAVVRAQISGSVLRMFVDQGKPVSAGEIIATIDNTALVDAVTSAKNAVTNAESAVALSHREQQRQETLLKSGAISEQSVDQARQNAVSAEAGLAQAKAMLATAEKQLGYATVRAPFSGVVSEKSASVGDVVQQGTAMYTIVDPSTLELQGTVPANALGIVHIGLTVAFDVTGYPDRNFVGTITRINPTADPMTRQVRVYAEIPNKGKSLVGGLYAEGRIASILKTTLTLPADAVDHKTITPAVIRDNHGVVERTTVTLGTMDEKNGQIEILSGINAGDTVLRGSAMEIALGSKVRTIAAQKASSDSSPTMKMQDTTAK
jgi:membrane fusion protein (multidrug efflux system)